MILSTATITNASMIKQQLKNDTKIITMNQQIFLGSASIIGDGESSILEIDAEKAITIKLDSSNSVVDFYISYNISCNGLTDEGVIILTIFLNDENISFNLVQTPYSKNGTLLVENIDVKRGDALGFRIDVAYGSLVPLYGNSTSSTGIGVITKAKPYINTPFLTFLQNHPNLFPLLWQILGL